MITANNKYILLLVDWVFWNYYLIWFKINKVKTLINSISKVDFITSNYAAKIDVKFCYINIKVWKIDGFTFKIYNIVLMKF